MIRQLAKVTTIPAIHGPVRVSLVLDTHMELMNVTYQVVVPRQYQQGKPQSLCPFGAQTISAPGRDGARVNRLTGGKCSASMVWPAT